MLDSHHHNIVCWTQKQNDMEASMYDVKMRVTFFPISSTIDLMEIFNAPPLILTTSSPSPPEIQSNVVSLAIIDDILYLFFVAD